MDKEPAGKQSAPPKSTTEPAAPPNAAGKAAPDWEKIEADYRAGVLSLREIAAANPGVSHQAIAKRAKASNWDRDISAKIQARADSLVDKALVDSAVDSKKVATERQIVDANARAIADVRLAHRKDIARAKGIANSMLDELEDGAQAYELEARVKMSKTLIETLRIAIDMERQAFGMDAKGADGASPGTAGYVPPAIRIVHVTAPARQEDDDAAE